MALGAISKPSSATVPSPDITIGAKSMNVRDVVLTTGANYTSGGEQINPVDVGLTKRIEAVFSIGVARATAAGATARTVSVNYAAISGSPGAVKLQVYTTASAEAAGNSDQSAFNVRLGFYGI